MVIINGGSEHSILNGEKNFNILVSEFGRVFALVGGWVSFDCGDFFGNLSGGSRGRGWFSADLGWVLFYCGEFNGNLSVVALDGGGFFVDWGAAGGDWGAFFGLGGGVGVNCDDFNEKLFGAGFFERIGGRGCGWGGNCV